MSAKIMKLPMMFSIVGRAASATARPPMPTPVRTGISETPTSRSPKTAMAAAATKPNRPNTARRYEAWMLSVSIVGTR